MTDYLANTPFIKGEQAVRGGGGGVCRWACGFTARFFNTTPPQIQPTLGPHNAQGFAVEIQPLFGEICPFF